MKKTLFTGSGVAIVTPYTENGVDFDMLGNLIEFQIAGGTDAIVICGTTGEASTMPDEEHLDVIRYGVEKVAGRIPVIAGTGSNDTTHGIRLSKRAQELGADGLLLVTPYYNKASQKGLYEHFSKTAQSVDIPVILYNVPSRTGVTIAIDTYKKLAEIDNIVAVKEASGNLAYASQIRAACGDKLDLYSGNDDVIVPMLSIGGKGVISVLANVLPQETHDICARYFAGDVQGSMELQLKYMDLIAALFIEVNPIPVKAALGFMGFDCGKYRLPLCEMEEKNAAVLKEAMKGAGIALV